MKAKKINVFILGGGMTGLAAGFASGLPIYEAADIAGGICSSYYMRPDDSQKYTNPPNNHSAYRFEIGGGHWIFGGDPKLNQFLSRFGQLKRYKRRSSVYFHQSRSYVPYPLQNHLRSLDRVTAVDALDEMSRPSRSSRTMKEWLERSFGPTLCELFFYPFHDLYTAGLYDRIAPQDEYKSPVDLATVIQGALNKTSPVGYNTSFLYPRHGLDQLAQELAAHCDIHFGHKVTQINASDKEVLFANGDTVRYDKLISTLPLNQMVRMAGIAEKDDADPYSSVLVLNIGARSGPNCPNDHWLYTPDAHSGFHRVGFYSNVDRSFLPKSARKNRDRVSIYVERAFDGGARPQKRAIKKYADSVVAELQDWKFIKAAEIVDPTWIDVAYTWSWPDSNWKKKAVDKLDKFGIYQVGRYALWRFHGIAESIRDGLYVGSTLKPFKNGKI